MSTPRLRRLAGTSESWLVVCKRRLPPDLTRRSLLLSLAFSLLVHTLLLLLNFEFPVASKAISYSSMEVVLVNTKSKRRPRNVQALAQFNMDGGGNITTRELAQTPMPNQFRDATGSEIEKRKRSTQLTSIKQQLLTANKTKQKKIATGRHNESKTQSETALGYADENTARAMAKLEAAIALKTRRYNSLPRKMFLSPRTLGYDAAFYLTEWAYRIERVGKINYPRQARGKLYGSVIVYVELRHDGSVHKSSVEKGSGHPVLDEAALLIIHKAAPFGKVPPTVLGKSSILAFSRTINFTRSNVARVQ